MSYTKHIKQDSDGHYITAQSVAVIILQLLHKENSYNYYEGRSVYKLLSAAIFSIFWNKNNQNIRFEGNSILNIPDEIRYHDNITATSGRQ